MAFSHGCSEEHTKSMLGLSEVSPTQTRFDKSLFIEVPSLFTVAESQYLWTFHS